MPSITYWNRIEPRARTESIDAALQARVRDPLWIIARQWQLGEFQAQDGGSPAWVQLTERSGALASWQAGAATAPLNDAPLEEQLLREPFTPDLATAVELGQIFERCLADAGAADLIDAYRGAYPIASDATDPADRAEATLRRVCAGRAADGVALYIAARAASPAAPALPALPAARQPAALHAIEAFVAWIDATLGPIGPIVDALTWQPARLEYGAAVTAAARSGLVTLNVSPGSDGLVDWAAFDARPGSGATAPPAATVRSVVPAHVRFRGMPNARFWDFETGTADFGEIAPDRCDLARLALIDFMMVHANDWFVLPVDVRVGSIYQLDSLIVHDVFGVDTLIARADREALGPGRWTMFGTAVAGSGGTADFFLLPSSAGSALQIGRPVEEVRFARDETADMVWAIEYMLENQLGEPWPQHERDVARHGGTPVPPPPSGAATPLRYRIETRVPEHWIPLLPVSIDPAAGRVVLELAALLAADDDTPILPRGRILRPSTIDPNMPYRLAEEEVPRSGIRVQRVVCRSRWIDGSTRIWQMRRVQPGTGEANSALRFDVALSGT